MMSEYVKCVLLLLSLITVSCQKNSSDAIGFPEVEENVNLMNKQNRSPVFIPAKCPINELLYPGDQKDDWICDCRPSYLYHPESDKCWPVFKMGPCQPGQYLILPTDSVIPICVPNPCINDNLVIWKGRCESLGATAPCGNMFPVQVLWVNATTLAIDCIALNLETRFYQEIQVAPKPSCPVGCKRHLENKCQPSVN